ncbi:hypothetical protein KVR01_001230 [Diaporthe batatas]|uniref:uncharacterized protein n=1 Tax=Diaporthe batatas TaxID=748121 RepID=UPI001D05C198|nr:uncharacterized protein KVR01_001230 [Diaporthe batatas]KAG8168481.1 hypothetical protein KVR01_001230 [Diaporthe batatas]
MAAPQLPDFHAIRQHFNALGDQLQRFAIVPDMQEGQLLHNIIQQNNDILQQLVTLNHRVDGLSNKLDQLENRFWQTNNRLPTPEYLEGLHNMQTNGLIPNLPNTVQGIQSLNLNNANRILEELGHEPSGNLVARKRRILLEFGVTQQLTDSLHQPYNEHTSSAECSGVADG